MFSLLGKGKRGVKKNIVIIDVGSGSVGAALVTLNKEGAPALLGQTRIETPLATSRSSKKIADLVRTAAKEAIGQIEAVKRDFLATFPNEIVSQVAIFLPAPWCTLFLRNIRVSRITPVRVTPAFIERMVADYVRTERPDEKNEEVIERSAVGIRLNGYAVEDIPKDSMASTIELAVVSATAHKEFVSRLRDMVYAAFGHSVRVTFHSTSIAAAYALSAVHPERPDYVLCNSEGELTELVFAFEHIPSGVATSTAGCNALLRTVSVHANMGRKEASSALILAHHARSPMAGKLAKTLRAATKECTEGFHTAAKALVPKLGAPSVIYILGNGPEAVWYADSVAAAPFIRSLFSARIPIEALGYAAIAQYVTIPPGSTSLGSTAKNGDVFLALEALFADARFDEGRTLHFRVNQVR